jgi:SAM-dependent methyltransferase
LVRASRASPTHVVVYVGKKVASRVVAALPPPVRMWLRHMRGDRRPPGRVQFGDLSRTAPVDPDFGYGRGTPVDRYYIESFLERNKLAIAGRVLEVGDDAYSRRFGAERVERQDILHVSSNNPRATIVGDLSRVGVLPRESFDCIVLTQTLHLIYDMRAAIAQLYLALRPQGVLLLTVPGISQIDRGDWSKTWYWALTVASVTRLLTEQFGPAEVFVESHGNVFAAVAFLEGVALEETPREKLLVEDEAYPVIVAARARKKP